MDAINITDEVKWRLIGGSAWVIASKAFGAVVVLLVSALLARLLEPKEMGVYFLIFSLVSVFTVFAQLGLGQTVVRLVGESLGLGQPGRAKAVVSAVLSLGTVGSFAVVGIVALGVGAWLARHIFDSPVMAGVMIWCALWVAGVTFQNLLAEIFRGYHDIRLATLFSGGQLSHGGPISSIIIVVLLGLLWMKQGQTVLRDVVMVSVASTGAVVVLGAVLLHRRMYNLAEEGQVNRREVLGVAWPVLLTNIMGIGLSQADIWVLGAFRPQEEVAVYGAAIRLVILVAMPLSIVNSVIPSTVAEMYAKGQRKKLEQILRTSATLVSAPALVVLLGFFFWGDILLSLVYGDYYSGGRIILVILSLGQLAYVWSGSCGLTLIMTGHPKTNMWITISSSILTVIGVLWAVRFFGVTGVAVAVASGFALQNVSMWLAVRLCAGMWCHVSISGVRALLNVPHLFKHPSALN